MQSECIVCRRISPKTIFRIGHTLYNGKLDKQNIHELCVLVMKTINYVDSKKRIFFCGRGETPLLGGLFYLYGLICREVYLTQEMIAYYLSIDPVTVRENYKRWIESFPKLFGLGD